VVGGFLVCLGTACAAGCTSGHAISGLANFELPSLIAVSGFFAGGLAAAYFILPFVIGRMSKTSVAEYQGCGAETSDRAEVRPAFLVIYLLLGIAFGIVLTRSEVLSWFRI